MAIDFEALRKARPEHAWCTTHRGVLAEQRCMRCLRFVCRHCVQRHSYVSGELGTCPVCHGGTRPLTRAERGVDYGLATRDWHALFRWPFRGDGKGVFWMGTAFMMLLGFPADFVRTMPQTIGELPIAPGYFMILLFVLGYLGALLVHVIANTASDPECELSWPQDHLAALLGGPFPMAAGCVLYTLLPALLLWIAGCFFLALFSGLLAMAVWPVIAIGAIALRSPIVLSPAWMWRTARRLGADYLRLLALVFGGTLVIVLPNLLVCSPARWVGVVVGGFAFFYMVLVIARAIGWIYVVHERRLGWFERDRPEPPTYTGRFPDREPITRS